jgi:hypothetical protein
MTGVVILGLVKIVPAAGADEAALGSLQVYVTRQDCVHLVAHHPAPGITYQPGKDVHGRAVPPADIPATQPTDLLPERLSFDLKVNPLAYGAGAATAAAPGSKIANTAVPVTHIEVDLQSGELRLDGHPLEDQQTDMVTEACRRAGYR